MVTQKPSISEVKVIIDDLILQNKLTPNMKAYLKKHYPVLIGEEFEYNEKNLDDLIELRDNNPEITTKLPFLEVEEGVSPKRRSFAKVAKSLASVAAMVVSAIGGYTLVKDRLSHSTTPHLDLEHLLTPIKHSIGNGTQNLSNLDAYVGVNLEGVAYNNFGQLTVNDKNRLPVDANLSVIFDEGAVITPQNTTEDAWILYLGDNINNMISFSDYYFGEWTKDNLTIWLDSNSNELVVSLEGGTELQRMPANATESNTLGFIEPSAAERVYIDFRIPECTNLSCDSILKLSQWDSDYKIIEEGQGYKFSAGSIVDLDVSVWNVNYPNDTVEIRLGDNTYVEVSSGRYNLTSDGSIFLNVFPIDDNKSADVSIISNSKLELELNRDPSTLEFTGDYKTKLNGVTIDSNSSKNLSTRWNVSSRDLSANVKGVDVRIPRGDMNTPDGWMNPEVLEGNLSIQFSALEYESQLEDIIFNIKNQSGRLVTQRNYSVDNQSRKYDQNLKLPLSELEFGNLSLEMILKDTQGNKLIISMPMWLGKPEANYSELKTSMIGTHLLIHGLVRHAVGEQEYNITKDGEEVHAGKFTITSDGSVFEDINIEGYQSGQYKINFEETKTEGQVEIMDYVWPRLVENNTYTFGGLEFTALQVNEGNATVRVYNPADDIEDIVLLNKTDGWYEEISKNMFKGKNGTEVQGIVISYYSQGSIYEYVDGEIIKVPSAGAVIGKRTNTTKGKVLQTLSDYPIKLVDIIDKGIIINSVFSNENTAYWAKEGFNTNLGMYLDTKEETVKESGQNITFVLDHYVPSDDDAYGEGYGDGYTNGSQDGYEAGNQQGQQEGYNQGQQEGYGDGYGAGYSNGYVSGKEDGSEEGYGSGYNNGYSNGSEDGYSTGHDDGFNEGHDSGAVDGYKDGLKEGYDQGHESGYEDGREATRKEAERLLAERRKQEYALGALAAGTLLVGYGAGKIQRARKKENGLQVINSIDELNSLDSLFDKEDELEDFYSKEPNSQSYAEVEDIFGNPEAISEGNVNVHDLNFWLEGKDKTISKLNSAGYNSMHSLLDAFDDYVSTMDNCVDNEKYHRFFKEKLGFSEKASKGLSKRLRKYGQEIDSVGELEEF